MLMTLSVGRALRFEIGVSGALPEWTPQDAALAAQHVAEHHWEALRFTFAGVDTRRVLLRDRLVQWLAQACEAARWPARITTHHGSAEYFCGLAELHLIEERQPWRFQTNGRDGRNDAGDLHAIIMDVPERVWLRKLRPIYGALQTEWLRWQADAHDAMWRRLRQFEAA